jgi:antitoxin component YwqK of YwqJK toxin-antitoxin module
MKNLNLISTFDAMKKIYLSVALLGIIQTSFAQKTTRLYETYFSHPEDMIQNEEGGGYHFRVGDTLEVSMSDDGYYKLTNTNGDLLEEGDTDEGDSEFTRHGKWTEYYSNGKMKAVGNYFHNEPYGHWQLFDPEEKLATEFDILVLTNEDGITTYCKAGSEIIYRRNGKIMEEHFYKAEPYMGEDRVLVEDPVTEKKAWKMVPVKAFRPKPFGTWVYYNADGTVEKREDKKD